MLLKQSFKNHIIISGFTWTITIIFFGIWHYLNYDPDFFFIGGIFYLIFTIPALFLHIHYTLRNAGEEIEINPFEIILKKNKMARKYCFKELAKIIIYKPASLDNWGIPFTAMEYYRYARIITKSGEEIIITCLMTLNLEEVGKKLSGVPIERKKRIAFLFWK